MAINQEYIIKIKTLISKGKIKTAFEVLIPLIESGGDTKKINAILLLQNQFLEIDKREKLNLPVKVQYRNKVIYSLLQLVDQAGKSTEYSDFNPIQLEKIENSILSIKRTEDSQKKKKIVIVASSSVVLLGAIIFGVNFFIIIMLILIILLIVLSNIISFNKVVNAEILDE